MSIKFLVLGGGYFGFLGGGGECQFYLYGREDFSDNWSCRDTKNPHSAIGGYR